MTKVQEVKKNNAVFIVKKPIPRKKQKNLSYEEVKSLSEEYSISCKIVYELHAEYISLASLAQDTQVQEEDSGNEEEKDEDEE